MKIKTNFVKLLAVLAILGSMVAIAAVPASAAAGIGLTPHEGPVGTSVTIQATGFAPTTVVIAKFDGAVMTTAPATVTTDAAGAATFAVLIPTATNGLHLITVTDGVNTAPSPATPNFTVVGKVVITSPASKSGPVGTSVTVSGTGFSGAGVTADVTIGGVALVSGLPVDSNGSFTGTGTVPSLTAGAQPVQASDGAGNVAAAPFDTFTVTPTLALTPNSGLPGDEVTLTGSGWKCSLGSCAAPAAKIHITFAGGSGVDVDADANGLINTAYVIPAAATAGVKSVVGTQGTTTASTTFTVVSRQLTLTPTSGAKGTTVVLTGQNMTSGGTITAANLLFGGVAWPGAPATINIDSAGTIFPTTLVVPTTAVLGANTVQATDSGGLIARATFTVMKPTITLNPTSGSINSSFVINGAGWLPGTTSGSTVTITFNYTNTSGTPATTSLTTIPDSSGSIAAAITVPADAKAGTAMVSAADAKNNSATEAAFTIPGAVIAVNPSQGPAGTSVTVTGSGFLAYTAITVKIGNYQFLAQPLTDVFGIFTYTLTVPGVAPGAQSITANDGTNLASAYFVVATTGATVQSQTTGIASSLVRIWGYSGGTWYMYDPADLAGSNLATLTSGAGYWVDVNAAGTLIYGGFSYPLIAGWNLIGWR
jgi:hypothetical protein